MAHATMPRTWHRPARSLTHRFASSLQDAWAAYLTYRAERETVHMLQSLDNRTLKDIGLDRSEIESVARSPSGERRIRIDASGDFPV